MAAALPPRPPEPQCVTMGRSAGSSTPAAASLNRRELVGRREALGLRLAVHVQRHVNRAGDGRGRTALAGVALAGVAHVQDEGILEGGEELAAADICRQSHALQARRGARGERSGHLQYKERAYDTHFVTDSSSVLKQRSIKF